MRAALAGESSVGTGDKVSVRQTDELSIFSPRFIATVELTNQQVSQTVEDISMFSGTGEICQFILDRFVNRNSCRQLPTG